MEKAHLKVQKPLRGVIAITAFRLLDQNGKKLLYFQLEDKKELKKFFKYFPSDQITWDSQIKWQ